MDAESLIETLRALCGLSAPSGQEREVVAWCRDRLRPFADMVEVDPFGNLVALRRGPAGAPRLMVAAHADEVGLIVRRIERNGFVRFTTLGCPTVQLLPGRRVRVGRHEGVIGVKSDHYLSPEEREHRSVPDVPEQYVDLGATSAEEVLALGVEVGTPITHVSELFRLGESGRWAGKSIDNRLGCALLLHLFAETAGRSLPVTLLGLVTVQEEAGSRGATMAVHRHPPDLALVLDVTICEDTPEFPPPTIGSLTLGGGPVIHVMEQSAASNRGMLAHPAMVRELTRCARERGIPHQRALLLGGATDAANLHLAGGGIPTAYLGIPCRYAHSPVEVFDAGDALHTLALAAAFVETPPALGSLTVLAP